MPLYSQSTFDSIYDALEPRLNVTGEITTEVLFVCAWRPSKLCKGFCGELGID